MIGMIVSFTVIVFLLLSSDTHKNITAETQNQVFWSYQVAGSMSSMEVKEDTTNTMVPKQNYTRLSILSHLYLCEKPAV